MTDVFLLTRRYECQPARSWLEPGGVLLSYPPGFSSPSASAGRWQPQRASDGPWVTRKHNSQQRCSQTP